MLNARVIPCLLLKDKGLVKTVQFKDPRYLGDPINAVWIFNKCAADELIFVDIMASREGKRISNDLVSKLSDECFMPLAVGGGIREIEDIRELLNAGAEKVCVNSTAVENPSFVRQAADKFGSQAVLAAIDVKKTWIGRYEVVTHGGSRKTGIDPVKHASDMESMGAGEIFLTSVDMVGMMKGYDLELIRRVSDAVGIPVIACGGAGSLEDLREAIKEGHASAAAAGSLFVYRGSRNAVLINFPSKEEINAIVA